MGVAPCGCRSWTDPENGYEEDLCTDHYTVKEVNVGLDSLVGCIHDCYERDDYEELAGFAEDLRSEANKLIAACARLAPQG